MTDKEKNKITKDCKDAAAARSGGVTWQELIDRYDNLGVDVSMIKAIEHVIDNAIINAYIDGLYKLPK